MLLSPVVRLLPLPTPIAMLPPPIMLLWSAKKPIAVLLAPSVLCSSAPSPTAVLKKPVLFEKSANAPLAVFWKPLVLLKSAPAPVAVFSTAELLKSAPAPIPVQRLPSVILSSEYTPIPVLYTPVVRLPRARYPSARLAPGQPGSGESQAARVCGENAKQTITSGMRNKPRGDGAWFIGFLSFTLRDVRVRRIVFFIVFGFSRAGGFLEIRRIAYEFYCPVQRSSVNQSEDAFFSSSQSAQREGITFVKADAARSRSPLLDFTGKKQPRYRRHPWRKDRHHLQTRRTYFCQAQRGKPDSRRSSGARNLSLGHAGV